MNKVSITYLLLALCLNLTAYPFNKAIEQFIDNGNPYKLEQLLKNGDDCISNDTQLQIYLNLADKIADHKKQALSQPETVRPGTEYKRTSFRLFTLASLYGMWFILTIWNAEIAAKYRIGYAFGLLETSAFLGSYLLWVKGDREFKQSGWRTREQEYLDAFLVKQILNNLLKQRIKH